MSDSRAALGLDRLPWLTDEPQAAPRSAGSRRLALLGVAARPARRRRVLLARPAERPRAGRASAGSAVDDRRSARSRKRRRSREVDARPRSRGRAGADARPCARCPERQVPLRRSAGDGATAKARPFRRTAQGRSADGSRQARQPPGGGQRRRTSAPLSRGRRARSSGAAGRLVRIGAFGSRHQAKLGWWAIVRAYPALSGLPTVVDRQPQFATAGIFYRLQIGTTSQAHSEVLVPAHARRSATAARWSGCRGSRKASNGERSSRPPMTTASCRGCRRSTTRTSRAAFRRARCSPRWSSSCSRR